MMASTVSTSFLLPATTMLLVRTSVVSRSGLKGLALGHLADEAQAGHLAARGTDSHACLCPRGADLARDSPGGQARARRANAGPWRGHDARGPGHGLLEAGLDRRQDHVGQH